MVQFYVFGCVLWLGLGTKKTWLGLREEHVLAYNTCSGH